MTLAFMVMFLCVGLVAVTEASTAVAEQIADVMIRWPRAVIVFQIGWTAALAVHLLGTVPR